MRVKFSTVQKIGFKKVKKKNKGSLAGFISIKYINYGCNTLEWCWMWSVDIYLIRIACLKTFGPVKRILSNSDIECSWTFVHKVNNAAAGTVHMSS